MARPACRHTQTRMGRVASTRVGRIPDPGLPTPQHPAGPAPGWAFSSTQVGRDATDPVGPRSAGLGWSGFPLTRVGQTELISNPPGWAGSLIPDGPTSPCRHQRSLRSLVPLPNEPHAGTIASSPYRVSSGPIDCIPAESAPDRHHHFATESTRNSPGWPDLGWAGSPHLGLGPAGWDSL